ncbi:uncharacterized protein [Typha angustifolia]|uniref:uncharacterized protein isoform X2 n=1 Tax=Typha angustifolia TaxID=59011 RepID=UPI003C2AC2A1
MAYIPPHKRHSKNSDTPTPIPDSLSPHFKQTLTLTGGNRRRKYSASPSSASPQGGKIRYAAHSISRWLSYPAAIPESFRLEPFSCELIERKSGGKPLILACGGGKAEIGEEDDGEMPWVEIARRIETDIVVAAWSAREEVVDSVGEEAKMSFVARFGKVLFHGDSSASLNSIRKAASAEEGAKNQVHKTFYANVPDEYMKEIELLVVKKVGLEFAFEKEHYHVELLDKHQPDSTISCKCSVQRDGKLQVYKIELNQVRHMVVDVSCLYKDLDLRMMLGTKKMLKNLDDEVENGINKLISSAVIDSDVKGGLRWPLGQESATERFNIIGVWHTKYKSFRCQTLRLRVRHADRFNYRTLTGEVANEVTLKLTEIGDHLRSCNLETSSLADMVQAALKMIWGNFLSYTIASAVHI